MKKAVIYARYSCDRQTEQSIEGQLSVCQDFCAKEGYQIEGAYIDRAMTGTNDKRADFQRMIEDAATHAWEYIIVYKLDRFSRNREETAIYKLKLRKNGVKLVSATEDIPDGSGGIMYEAMLEAMAEYYSAELSEKVKRGLAESRKKHQFLGGFTPYGYTIIDKKPQICPVEAEIVRGVYNDYAEGATVPQIVQKLSVKGICTKNGHPFTRSNLYKLLQASVYKGNDTYPPIVPEDIWRTVDGIHARNKHAPATRKALGGRYYLSGKVFCGKCGEPMVGYSGAGARGAVYRYYADAGRIRKHNGCDNPNVGKDLLENAVYDACCACLDDEAVDKISAAVQEEQKKKAANNPLRKSLEKRLAGEKKAMQNLIRALEMGIFNADTKTRMDEIDGNIKTLKNAIEVEKSKERVMPKAHISQFLRNLQARTDTDEAKRNIIRIMVNKVYLYNNFIRIILNVTGAPPMEYRLDEEENLCNIGDEKVKKRGGGKGYNYFLVPFPPPRGRNTNFLVTACVFLKSNVVVMDGYLSK